MVDNNSNNSMKILNFFVNKFLKLTVKCKLMADSVNLILFAKKPLL